MLWTLFLHGFSNWVLDCKTHDKYIYINKQVYRKLQVISSKLKQIPVDFWDAHPIDSLKGLVVCFDARNTNCPKLIQWNKR